QSAPSDRARMRGESEDIPKAFAIRSSQEQIPKHQNIGRPPGKSYPNTNTHLKPTPVTTFNFKKNIHTPISPEFSIYSF
ncbi:MAG TPA: hypothetical protein VKZ56_08245, partial [Membranihabitans sp.]|nr:hypothetical protein [Membranihabitans sp.]